MVWGGEVVVEVEVVVGRHRHRRLRPMEQQRLRLMEQRRLRHLMELEKADGALLLLRRRLHWLLGA